MPIEVTILGCGSSAGVPVIGCDCSTCTSNDPKNDRTRASILIKQGNTRLLVDTSPDLRRQALREKIPAIDAIFLTHFHADHVMGIDDIRSFNYINNSTLLLYSDADTFDKFAAAFPYILREKPDHVPWVKPEVKPIEVKQYDEFTVNGELHVSTMLQYHGKSTSMGIRVGDFAYSTDVNNLPEQSLQLLEKLDVWVVDCLRVDPAPTHAHLALTLEWIGKLKPKRAILTHMSHHFDYEKLKGDLPSHITPAYDGLYITL